MGGRGSGGHPAGGRKPDYAVDMTGPLPDVEAPKDLSLEERAAWDDLALLARQQRTLVPATVESFRLLCRAVAIERKLAANGDDSGNYRGWLKEVVVRLKDFKLAPLGKPMPMVESEKPKNALELLQAQRVSHIRAV